MSVIASRSVIARHEAISPFCASMRFCAHLQYFNRSPLCSNLPTGFCRHCEERSNLPFYPSFPFCRSLRGTKQSHPFSVISILSVIPRHEAISKKDCRENINIHLNNKHQLVFSRNDVKRCSVVPIMSVIAILSVIARHETISPFCPSMRFCAHLQYFKRPPLCSNLPTGFCRHCEARSNLPSCPSFPFFPSFPGTKQFPKKIAAKTSTSI